MSPRLQQKVLEMEKQSSPTPPSSELKRGKRQSRKQPTESSPQSQSARPNPPTLQQREVQLSENSSDRRSSSCQDDAMSVQSESRLKFNTNFEVEVTSTGRSNDFNDAYQQKGQKNEENLAARLSEDKSLAELRTVSIEQPSPVSVLDATFYREGSPSPVKKISNAFKDDNSLTSDGAEWNSMDLLDDLLDKVPNLDSKFNRNELKNTMNLVQKLKEISSLDGEATLNDTASLFQNMNEEHRYIAEIMLVSGILFQDPATRSTTIQLHPPGHVINPNLFLVLERTKRSTELHGSRSNSNEKIQRKLIFDAVQEILVNKAKSSDPWISRNKLITRSPSGMKLLGEVCSEIDHIQPNKDSSPDDEDDSMSTIIEDFMNQSENWADYCSEVPEVVIDIERQIFKDLIVEAVIGEAVGSKGQPSKYCRQLFSR